MTETSTDIEIDHLMWGAPTLEAGVKAARALFRTAPAAGGVHPRLGTRNALLSLGKTVYLEVIAPDPAQDLAGTFGERLATLTEPGLITWAAAAPALEEVARRARDLALSVRGPVPTERTAPDGRVLRWQLLFLGGHPHGGLVPFFIDWMDTPHPAQTNPSGGRFLDLVVSTPEAAALDRIYRGLGVNLPVVEARESHLSARIEVDGAEVRLDSAPDATSWSF